MPIDSLLDHLLVFGILLFAASALLVSKLFSAIVLFISLGLIVSLVWIRLGAVDVAIAEAAIGAGVTGVMLLAAWKRLR
ncbi:MAG: putative MnhB-related membrane protein [Paraglaciecola sp.]|jgi:uncharacterized MnhB-related membrane protein